MSEPVTVLYARSAARVDDAIAEGQDLWLRLDDFTRVSGWTLKPEGACLGDACVSLPDGQRSRFVRGAGAGVRFNLAELARLLDMPVVADATTSTWCFGESAPARTHQLDSLRAPDFTLPDLDGRQHTLSDYRGNKVFLVAWASW